MTRHPFKPDLNSTTRKLTALRDDLLSLAGSIEPDSILLAHSPIVDQWSVRYVPMPVITGLVSGHPKIFDGPVTTTALWYLQQDLRWARTFSRFYRLGDYVGDAALLRAGLINPRAV